MHYILIARHEDVWLVGPFTSNDDAADYGAVAQQKLWNDDPRWQTLKLAKLATTYPLRVVAPDASLKVRPGAYERACQPGHVG